jgi:hypothetical protein
MARETKPQKADGYSPDVTLACERVLLTLLGAFGALHETLRLVGGLAPRYITPAAPPEVPPHAGTSDVDVLFDLQLIAEGNGYADLANQLEARGFQRLFNGENRDNGWRWGHEVDGIKIAVEFLRDASGVRPGHPVPIDGENVSAMAIPHAGVAHDWYIEHAITGELLNGGEVTKIIRVVDAVGFVILKALALSHRDERKDAADLIHVLRYAGDVAQVAGMFVARVKSGLHPEAISAGLKALRDRFWHEDEEHAYKLQGPVAYAMFLTDDAEERASHQRYAAGLVRAFIASFETQVQVA